MLLNQHSSGGASRAIERRLVAIFAIDVVGYTRLMELDEDGTHAHYISHRRNVIDPLIREHYGRIVKSTGDGLLAEFGSVAECVRCAVKVQNAIARRNIDCDPARQIRFRIGINFGSVIVEKDDIYGDGVNVAARIQDLASPGGIAISCAAVQKTRSDLDLDLDDLGVLILRNRIRPIRVYRFPRVGCATDVGVSLCLPNGRSPDPAVSLPDESAR